jgi:Putative zinc-finger
MIEMPHGTEWFPGREPFEARRVSNGVRGANQPPAWRSPRPTRPTEARRVMCNDAIELMADYLDAALGLEVIDRLERHLQDCPPCVAYLNTYRKTHALAAEAERLEMPAETKERLCQFLLAQFGRRS